MTTILRGIDISAHQTTTPSLAGLSFVIVRATYGTLRDGLYARHAAAVRKAGLELGAYHFGRNLPAAAQATAFLAACAQVPPDFFALDRERDQENPLMTEAQARGFIAGVQTARGSCGYYHSTSGFADYGEDWRWVADTRGLPQPPIPWDIWQYDDSGHLDRDRFDGTLADFRSITRGHGGGPNVPGGASVRDFTLIQPGAIGSITVKGPGHSFLRLTDGTLHPISAGAVHTPAYPIHLTEPISSGSYPGVDRQTGYLIGTQAAFVLAQDVTFTPAPDTTPFSKAQKDAAVTAALDHVAGPAGATVAAIAEARPR